MSQEIISQEPLCWIEDKFENRYHKECTLKYIADARVAKMDISVWNEVLTDYFIARYGEADTIDRFLYFSLPKYPKFIQDRFKTSLMNMGREQKRKLSYEQIKITVDSWIRDEEYYN